MILTWFSFIYDRARLHFIRMVTSALLVQSDSPKHTLEPCKHNSPQTILITTFMSSPQHYEWPVPGISPLQVPWMSTHTDKERSSNKYCDYHLQLISVWFTWHFHMNSPKFITSDTTEVISPSTPDWWIRNFARRHNCFLQSSRHIIKLFGRAMLPLSSFL